MKNRKNNKGFSLVELIVVIAIMAVLVGVLAPQFIKYVKSSKISTDVKNGQEIASCISVAMADPAAAAEWHTEQATAKKLTAVPGLANLPKVKASTTDEWYATWNPTNGEVKVFCSGSDPKYEVYPNDEYSTEMN